MDVSQKKKNRINSLHETALRVVYRYYNATFSELFSKDKSVKIHQRNLQLLGTEIFATKNELNPKIMEEIFTFKKVDYNLNNTSLKIGNVKTILTNLGVKIWKLLPNEYKELQSLSTFKLRLCKIHIVKIGFI